MTAAEALLTVALFAVAAAADALVRYVVMYVEEE